MGNQYKRNVILTDFKQPDDWTFKKTIEKVTNEDWVSIGLTSNKNHGGGVQSLIRYIKYFWLPFKIFIKRKKYGKVLAWQQFYGLILAFYLSIFHCKKTIDITVMTFIYKPKNGFKGKIYGRFMERIVCSKYVDRFIVFSRQEIDYYSSLFGVPKDRFHFMKCSVSDEYEKYKDEIVTKDTYLAAGRSNRDYDFLTSAWTETDPTLEIICDIYLYSEKSNVICYSECYGEDYLKKIAQCYAVIVPFNDENISAGQLVVLHAMMLGKPVICTKSETIKDYILPDDTAIMIAKDTDDLHNAMVRLADKEFYKKLSGNARDYFVQNFSYKVFAENIGKLIVAGSNNFNSYS